MLMFRGRFRISDKGIQMYKGVEFALLILSHFLTQLSRSEKVSFCDRSSSAVRHPLYVRLLIIDLNDNSSYTPSPILK